MNFKGPLVSGVYWDGLGWIVFALPQFATVISTRGAGPLPQGPPCHTAAVLQ